MKALKAVDDDVANEKASKLLGLTHKEREFAIEYLKNGRRTEDAALKAGYKPSTAKSKAYQIINKPAVKQFMRELLSKQFEEERMEVNEILARAARLARFDVRKLFDENGDAVPIHLLDEQTAAGIRAFETELIIGGDSKDQDEGESAKVLATRKYKFVDTLPALRLLAQAAQLLQPDVHTTNVFIDLDSRMDKARLRLRSRKEGAQDASVVSEQ